MAGTILSERQKDELHKSIAAYLTQSGCNRTVQTFREECDRGSELLTDDTIKKYENLLEKKWTSVVRLQKKIMDLEIKIQGLQSELDQATPITLSQRRTDPSSWLPRNPARHTLVGHRDIVNSIAFHPTFSVIASGSEDCTIGIWEWEHGDLERTIKGHTKSVLDVSFGGPSNAVLLASCSHDLTIKLWDPGNEYACIRTLKGHDHSVSCVRFIPSTSGSEFLVSASRDKTLKIWEVSTGYSVKTIHGHVDWVRTVEPSFDGCWMISAGNDQTARLWDTTTNEHKATFIGHDHAIECAVFAPPSSYLHLALLSGSKKTPSLTSSNEFLATGSRDKTIKLWDNRGSLLKTLIGHDNWVKGLAFHPAGKYLLSCSDDKTIRCWDLSQDARCTKVIENAHSHFVTSMKWAPSPQKIVNSLIGEPVHINGTPSKKKNDPQESSNIRCVLATGSVDTSLKIWAA